MLNRSPGGLQGWRVKTLPQCVQAPAGLTCRRGGGPDESGGVYLGGLWGRRVELLPQCVQAPAGLTCRRGECL
jgi:hypothetical protein